MTYDHLPRWHKFVHEHPFAIALLVFLLVVIPGFIRVQQITSQLHHNQLAACNSSNSLRADQIVLWEFIINMSKQPNNKQQSKQIDLLEKKINEIFAARKCP